MKTDRENTGFIFDTLHDAGHEVYLVGGCVRDLAALRPVHDYDFTTDALPDEMIRIFGEENIIPTGLRHGTVTVLHNNSSFEITTYRTDGDYSDHRRPDNVRFASTLEEDLSRRDFTMNALAMDKNGNITDLFGGCADLENGVLRCVGDPYERFDEDALRILRALRFASVYELSIEEKTAAAMHEKKSLLRFVSEERISSELRRFVMGNNACDTALAFSDVLAEIIPEFAPCIGFDQKSIYHRYDVFSHMMHAMGSSTANEYVRLALFLHDIEKPSCAVFDSSGHGHFKGHEPKSAETAHAVMRRLKFDTRTIDTVCSLIGNHHIRPADDRYFVKKLISLMGYDMFLLQCEVLIGDNSAKNDKALVRIELTEKMKAIAADVKAKGECCSLSGLSVNGNDLLGAGLKGKEIGDMLDRLLDRVMDGSAENEHDALMELVRGTCR